MPHAVIAPMSETRTISHRQLLFPGKEMGTKPRAIQRPVRRRDLDACRRPTSRTMSAKRLRPRG
jgi:hypothetical protein